MSIFDEFDEFIKKLGKLKRGSSGYSISVVYGPDGKPIVNVETYGDIDKKALKEEIKKMYPGAKIKGLEEEPLIKEVGMENRESSEEVSKDVKKKHPLIWEDEE